jgi:hypothetical protein
MLVHSIDNDKNPSCTFESKMLVSSLQRPPVEEYESKKVEVMRTGRDFVAFYGGSARVRRTPAKMRP